MRGAEAACRKQQFERSKTMEGASEKERLQGTHSLATLRIKGELEEMLETAVKEPSEDRGRPVGSRVN